MGNRGEKFQLYVGIDSWQNSSGIQPQPSRCSNIRAEQFWQHHGLFVNELWYLTTKTQLIGLTQNNPIIIVD